MTRAKIHLSKLEYELMRDAGFILTKNEILKKIKQFLEDLQPAQKKILDQSSFPPEVMQITPKVSRGENYQGLPWLVLDHPRYFSQADVCAIRTLFWWGRFFSMTLHLSGRYKTLFSDHSSANFDVLTGKGFALCVAKDEWQHHFDSTNYRPITEMSVAEFETELHAKDFIKVSIKFHLDQLNDLDTLLIESFEILCGCCGQLPRR